MVPRRDAYRCPAGERLTYRYTNEESGKVLRRYRTRARSKCPLKPERRIARWEHEHLLDAVQQRLDANPQPCVSGARRSSIRSHFLTKTLPKVAAEMALSVLAYNLTAARGDRGLTRQDFNLCSASSWSGQELLCFEPSLSRRRTFADSEPRCSYRE